MIDTEAIRKRFVGVREVEPWVLPVLCIEVDGTRLLLAEAEAALAAAEKQLGDVHDTLVDVMTQSCWHEGRYDTMCLSAYEGAAEYLVSVGLFVDCNEAPEEGRFKVMRFYKDAPKGAGNEL